MDKLNEDNRDESWVMMAPPTFIKIGLIYVGNFTWSRDVCGSRGSMNG